MLLASQIVAISLGVLLALALAVFAVIWHYVRTYGLTFAEAFLYFLNVLLTRTLWRTTVEGEIKLNPGQGAVFVANHKSPIDPLYLQMLIPRAMHWMIAKEYVEARFIGWPLRVAGAIPVNRRGIDTAATKLAIRYAEAGEMVGIFPEGQINTTDEFMRAGRPGAALVALRARVPVIPCYIEGAPNGRHILSPFYTPARVKVRIGEPIDLAEYYEREDEEGILEEMTRRFLRAIADLAGVHDFEPQIAGRRWKKHDDSPEDVEASEELSP
jgi:1-acyl-sn-glycerol-3-phosphate acyltransferase